ncbi:hypothetical protein [Streptomyces sp. NPDC048720]|uniref:hypothetical protein n=1 Tax=Streptomyces sp. NPDC048720 TaxID=3365588 RepID=UPI00371DC134
MNFKYIGAIGYLDSADRENESRLTGIMGFRVASDWFESVVAYCQGMTRAGDYDGSEILINVYAYAGPRTEFESSAGIEIDRLGLVQTVSIKNPYYYANPIDVPFE